MELAILDFTTLAMDSSWQDYRALTRRVSIHPAAIVVQRRASPPIRRQALPRSVMRAIILTVTTLRNGAQPGRLNALPRPLNDLKR